MSISSLQITQELLTAVIDNLANAVLVVDTDRRAILANKMSEKLTGQSRRDLYGKRVGKILGCVNATISPMGCGFTPPCQRCPIKHAVEETFSTKSGALLSDVQLEVVAAGMRFFKVGTQYLSVGDSEAVLISLEDMTEAKVQEQLRLEHGQLEAAIRTAAAVCHELNQPLMVMAGYTEMLLELRCASEEDYGMLKHLHEEIGRAGVITKKLMEIGMYKTKPYAGISRMLDLSGCSPNASTLDKVVERVNHGA